MFHYITMIAQYLTSGELPNVVAGRIDVVRYRILRCTRHCVGVLLVGIMAHSYRPQQFPERRGTKAKTPVNTGVSDDLTAHNSYCERWADHPKPRLKYMIANEIRALLAAAFKSPRDYAIFRLGYHHGLRASEIGLLEMTDWMPAARMENDRLMIHRLKNSISGETRIVPAAAEALRRWIKKRGTAPGPIFPSRKDKPISRRRLDELAKFYGKKAGIPEDKRHFHALRHTCATSLLSEHELDIAHVKDHLGHKNIQNTMIYAQLTAAASDARFNKIRSWR